MLIQKEELDQIEKDIDNYLVDKLDKSIPRYKYIYHMNLVYIDIILDTGSLFMPAEREWQFSLSYNIFLAHKFLKEETTTDFMMDPELYKYCMFMLVEGYNYAELCNIISSSHSGKGELNKEENVLYYKSRNIPKKNLNYLTQFIPRKILSYTFQILVGKMLRENISQEEIEFELTKTYLEFWNEFMKSDDFNPYDSTVWANVESTFLLAACKRFVNLYKSDFSIEKYSPAKIMIVMSSNGINNILHDEKGHEIPLIKKALDDMTYKVLGNGLFPKSNIVDAPIIKTKDGYFFMNPLVYLFNISPESRHLNYLRKYDKDRYSEVKANISERVIPIVKAMLNVRYPDAVVVCNFNVKIPNTKNEKRELDIFVVNQDGSSLYIEVKHFYNPISQTERNVLDKEFNKALEKMPKQIEAIKFNWETIKMQNHISYELKDINGVILSHEYVGYDVPINPYIPIINVSDFNSAMAESDTLEEFYRNCCENDKTLMSLDYMSITREIKYGSHEFIFDKEVIEPWQEALLLGSIKTSLTTKLKKGIPHRKFSSHEEAAKDFFGTYQ